jgi:manganese transport protein
MDWQVDQRCYVMMAAPLYSEVSSRGFHSSSPTLNPCSQAIQRIFAISLLASGLSSSSVGTMAGQVIMQGFYTVNPGLGSDWRP